jgi:hypothetical protein
MCVRLRAVWYARYTLRNVSEIRDDVKGSRVGTSSDDEVNDVINDVDEV